MVRVLRALLASGMLVLMVAGAASANTLNQATPLDPRDHEGSAEQCDGVVVADGQVYLHFLQTGTDADDLPATLTVTFSDGSSQTVDGYVNGDNSVVMFDVYAAQGLDITGAVSTINNDGNLVLSHSCFGGPPPEIPEAPFALILPLAAIGVLGAKLLMSRRRAGSAA